jgi:transglutaminase-like putative cysteine protease
MDRSVACSLSAEVLAPAVVELQVAVARTPVAEELRVTLDGEDLAVEELASEVGGRLHVVRPGPGRLEVTYRARARGDVEPVAAGPTDAATYLRPSRYAESDRLVAVAQAELGGTSDPTALVHEVVDWVGSRLSYVSGSSRVTDGAVDSLLAGAGVCRDYAHLTIALLRARDVPARLVSVYAPGLQPMDFHAVVEVMVDGAWYAVDATRLAPRSSLVRIATGRDAADTAFLSSYRGGLRFDEMSVTAVVDGDLPRDDVSALVRLR